MITFKADATPMPERRQYADELERAEDALEAALVAALRTVARRTLVGVSAETADMARARAADLATWQPVRDVLAAHLQRIAEAGADAVRTDIERTMLGVKRDMSALLGGIAWDLAHADAIAWAIASAGALVGEMAMNTAPRIQLLIAEWLTNGEPLYVLAERIQDGYIYSAERARAIAVTEVTRAFAEGNMMAWSRSGVVDRHRWSTSVDELVCPICAPLHNKIVVVGAEFALGITSPPAHTRCRCGLSPVVAVADEYDPAVDLPVGLENQPYVGLAGKAPPPSVADIERAIAQHGRQNWRRAFRP